MSHPIDFEDYRALAKSRLPRTVFDYLDGGADDEKGLVHNRAIFDRWRLRPSRPRDVSRRTVDTTIFGHPLSMPLVIAPTGLNGLFWPNGDFELAKAAELAGIPFILSTASTNSIEALAAKSGGDLWFQLYVIHRELSDLLVARAREARYSTLVVTVDVTINGYRQRDLRNGFGLPLRYTPRLLLDGMFHPKWLCDLIRHGAPRLANLASRQVGNAQVQAAVLSRQMDASFDWDDVRRLRDLWRGRLLLKGLLDPHDAQHAISLGIDGVILSNHGGRQLDCAVSPMEVLADTVAVAREAVVMIDSGFRRGSDIVKALALGADAVLLGRATLYGLAARGGAGVADVLRMLRDDIDRTIANIGCRSVSDLSRRHLFEASA